MKLIDVLNMISKGELEEGTIVVIKNIQYEYRASATIAKGEIAEYDLYSREGDTLFDTLYITQAINEEAEIIPPEKWYKTNKKIEKLDIKFYVKMGLVNPQNNEKVIVSEINKLSSENNEMAKKINEIIERMNELCGEKR